MRRKKYGVVGWILCVGLCLSLSVAAADGERWVRLGLVVGERQSGEADRSGLHHADRDAARFFALLRILGAQTYLLTSPGEGMGLAYPQAAAEARRPNQETLAQTWTELGELVAQAHRRNLRVAFYLVYVGLAREQEGRYQLGLQDGWLDGRKLLEQAQSILGAEDKLHLWIDAPGAAVLAFVAGKARPGPADMGLLLNAEMGPGRQESRARKAGVFSHLLHTGLSGAADGNGDGVITYREIAGYVQQTRSGVGDKAFHTRIFAQAPKASDYLIDLTLGSASGGTGPGSSLASFPLETRCVSQVGRQAPRASDKKVKAGSHWQSYAGWGSLGLAAASVLTAAALNVSAQDLRSGADPETRQEEVEINENIKDRNTAAVVLYSVASASAIAGMVFLLQPGEGSTGQVSASVGLLPQGAVFTLGGRF